MIGGSRRRSTRTAALLAVVCLCLSPGALRGAVDGVRQERSAPEAPVASAPGPGAPPAPELSPALWVFLEVVKTLSVVALAPAVGLGVREWIRERRRTRTIRTKLEQDMDEAHAKIRALQERSGVPATPEPIHYRRSKKPDDEA